MVKRSKEVEKEDFLEFGKKVTTSEPIKVEIE
jgi:hypothetical protein